jgi:hypothetical protein
MISGFFFQLTFNKAYNRGRIVHDQSAKDWIKLQEIAADPIEIECFPFYSFMLALNRMRHFLKIGKFRIMN